MKDDLPSLLDYNLWANRILFEALAPLTQEVYAREPEGGGPAIRSTLVHLAGATRAWTERFDGRDATVLPTVEEVPTLSEAARMLNEADARISAFLSTRTEEHLKASLVWKNLQGKERSAPLWTVFRHTVNHASYHRGQIAATLRRVGGTPLATDLVRWAIERHEAGAFRD